MDNCTGTRSKGLSRAVSAVIIVDKGRFGTVLESRIIETLISYSLGMEISIDSGYLASVA